MDKLEDIHQWHKAGDFARALEGYESHINNAQGSSEVHYLASDASLKLGQTEVALKHIKNALSEERENDKYLQHCGQVLLQDKQFDKAVSAFKKSLKVNPNLFYSYLAIADIRLIQNQIEQARKNYKLALKVYSDGVPAIVKLAKLDLLAGLNEKALKRLNDIHQQYPEEVNIRLYLGICKLESGESGLAEFYFRSILEKEPNNIAAKIYLAISLTSSEPEEALRLLQAIFAETSVQIELHAAMGLYHLHLNNHVDALRHLQQVVDTHLAYPSWIEAYACALYKTGGAQQAETVFHSLFDKTKREGALVKLGSLQMQSKHYESALKTWDKLCTIDPAAEQPKFNKARCYVLLDQYSKAINQLEQLLEKNKTNQNAQLLLVEALLADQQFEQAFEMADGIKTDLLTISQKNRLWRQVGLAKDQLDQFEQAYTAFKKQEFTQAPSVTPFEKEAEKHIQEWSYQPAENDTYRPIFLFGEAETGMQTFKNWLNVNQVPLVDHSHSSQQRHDFLSEAWTLEQLQQLDETEIHLLRKKYRQKLKHAFPEHLTVVDLIPLDPIASIVIKRIFPDANILVLTRNSLDINLHQLIYGPGRIDNSQFKPVLNQIIGMGMHTHLIDVDQWQANDEKQLEKLSQVLNQTLSPVTMDLVDDEENKRMPLGHWKNYKQLASQ